MPAKRYEPPALEFKTEDQHETAKKVGKGVAIVVAGVVVLAAAVWGWQFFMEVEKKKGKSVDKSKELPNDKGGKNVKDTAKAAADKVT